MQGPYNHRDQNSSIVFPSHRSGKSIKPNQCVRHMKAFLPRAASLGEQASWLTGSCLHAHRLRTLSRRFSALEMSLNVTEQAVNEVHS
jgi:hypothetical protein